jgi:hypothetical protein
MLTSIDTIDTTADATDTNEANKAGGDGGDGGDGGGVYTAMLGASTRTRYVDKTGLGVAMRRRVTGTSPSLFY